MAGMKAPRPENEAARLEVLRHYHVLDTLPEASYDDIVKLAAHICGTPTAAITFIDSERHWSKAMFAETTAERPRDVSLCAYAILNPQELTVVPDAPKDARFAANPLVTGPEQLRFYAGAPLVTEAGEALGTLCVTAPVARTLNPEQAFALSALARQVMAQLELRRQTAELERANIMLAQQNATDPSTGLANRREFEARLDAETDRVKRYGGTFSLAMIDIDHFKIYNDRFGHPAGDDVLRNVAALLSGSVRQSDVVARYGGEEFAIIMLGTEFSDALLLGERCRQAVEAAPWVRQRVTLSVGIASVTTGLTTGRALTEAADRALYEAKRAGRNRVVSNRVWDELIF